MVRTILVVDDNLNDAELTTYALQACGKHAPTLYARDGEEGLALLDSNASIGLVLLDLKLPKVDGFEFLKYIRKNPKFVDLPVVVVSSSLIEADKVRANLLGASHFVTKALDFPEFATSLCAAIELHPLS